MKRILLPVAALTMLYVAGLALWPESLNHNSEYAWPVLNHGVANKLIPASVALLIVIATIVWIYRKANWEKLSRWRSNLLGLVIFITALLLQVVPMTVHKMGLLEFPLRIYLPDHTSYFSDAIKINEKELFGDFAKLVPQLNTHSRTHPPGAILFFKTIVKLTEGIPGLADWYNRTLPRSQEAGERFHLSRVEVCAGGLAALVIIFLATLTPSLMIWFGKLLEEKQGVIWIGACLFILTPVFSNKSPVLDQFFAFLFVFGISFFLRGIKRGGLWEGFLSGFFFSSCLGWSYTFLAAPLFCLFLAVAWIRKSDSPQPFPYLTIFLITLLSFPLVAWIAHANPLAIYRANLAGWHFNNTTSGRIHMWKWILFNPYEFFAWLGVPVFCFFALAVWREVKKVRLRQWSEADPLVWAIFIFGLALDLSGRVCYESPRLAWFYAPFVCLVAAKGFANTEGLNRAWGLAVILVLQAATVLVFRMLF